MRVLPLVLAALLAVPLVDAGSWKLLAHRYETEPGWWAESFSLNESEWIAVRVGDDASGEFVANVIALYDGAGVPLASVLFVSPGGKIVDVAAHADALEVRTDDMPGLGRGGTFEDTIYFRCGAACNPSRAFKLAVTAAGDLDAWGYGVFVFDGQHHGATNASKAWAMTSREMQGFTLHASGPLVGASIVQGAAVDATIDDMLVGVFLKDGAQPRQMRAQTPTGDVDCTCFLPNGPAGAYRFLYEDVDTWGREAWLTYADVRLP